MVVPPKLTERERRLAARETKHIAVEIAIGGQRHLAVMQDASSAGLRCLSRRALEVGSTVDIEVVIPGEEGLTLTATIVRCEAAPDAEPWLFLLAMKLQEPSPNLMTIASLFAPESSSS